MTNQKFLTEIQTSEYLGLSTTTLRHLRSRPEPYKIPEIPFYRIGSAIRYLREDLDCWLQAKRIEKEQ